MIGDVTWKTTVTMSLPMCRLRGSCCLEQSADYLQLGGNCSAGCRTAGLQDTELLQSVTVLQLLHATATSYIIAA